jgi:two-component system LytT family sensor kinase
MVSHAGFDAPMIPSGQIHEDPREHVPLTRTELALIVAFWLFVALLSAANSIVDPRGPRSPQPSPALPFLQSALWAILTPAIFWMASRYRIERGNVVTRVLLYIVAGLVVAMVVDGITAWARMEVFDDAFAGRGQGSRRRDFGFPFGVRERSRFSPIFGIRRVLFIDELTIFFGVTAAGFARDYFRRYQRRRDEATELRAHTTLLEGRLAEAQLSALRTQLNPHFLFNTLNAVSALAERDPAGVRRMIARLSELLRYTLDGSQPQEVPLSQELDFLDRYLELMQIRFGGRLQVEKRIASDTWLALVPNLILQPLVENALKHGTDSATGGRIIIEARRDEDRLILEVADTGPGLQAGGSTVSGSGLGLPNVRDRLRHLYEEDQSLTLRDAEGGGVVAEVSLPYHTRDDIRAAAEHLR